jgi:Predicted membrane protein
MIFVDDLGLDLFLLAFTAFLLSYGTASALLSYMKGRGNEVREKMRALSVPLGILGFFILVMGIEGEFVWPLPNFGNLGYDILFFDGFSMLGILLLAAALAINMNRRLEYIGLLSMMFGLTVIFYGAEAYSLGMTKEPFAMFGLYTLFGLSGVAALPGTITADRAVESAKVGRKWIAMTYVYLFFLVVSGLAALAIAAPAIASHLASAP